jgi:hypothetical protein
MGADEDAEKDGLIALKLFVQRAIAYQPSNSEALSTYYCFPGPPFCQSAKSVDKSRGKCNYHA